MTDPRTIRLTVNGEQITATVEPRRLFSDFLREDLGLTGTHVGCEQGACGACTVLVDGRTARSCLAFAVQLDGANVTTIEGVAGKAGLHPVQQAFHEAHALQCGFCTPGFIISAIALLQENADPSTEDIQNGLSGNLCRCTGYQNIVRAVQDAAARRHSPVGKEV
jgi:carbon-monoxide dehydrogenase small subunit